MITQRARTTIAAPACSGLNLRLSPAGARRRQRPEATTTPTKRLARARGKKKQCFRGRSRRPASRDISASLHVTNGWLGPDVQSGPSRVQGRAAQRGAARPRAAPLRDRRSGRERGLTASRMVAPAHPCARDDSASLHVNSSIRRLAGCGVGRRAASASGSRLTLLKKGSSLG